MSDTLFASKVYGAVVRIPRGRVATYGQIAEIIGCKGGSRAVGNALHKNPYAPDVPCHRVVNADGRLADHFGGGGASVQKERLEKEGVSVNALTDSGKKEAGSGKYGVDLNKYGIIVESHPLEPFLPENGKVLFLGSFPPPKARWSMEFFYPNWINDFWRIQGMIHFSDPKYFEKAGEKRFDRENIITFCKEKGFAFFDTAKKVCRLKGNASDEFLEILEPSDVMGMLKAMPGCHTIVTTGGKSSEELQKILATDLIPKVGESIKINSLTWYRMPSTSRAYPMSLEKKAEMYKRLEI